MGDIPNFGEEVRAQSKGEADQEYADLGIMGVRLLGMRFTTNERYALAVVIGAVVREAPKVERSNLVKTLRMITNAVT